jgi:aspartate/methionine/tyrosine aminotransferase
MYAFPRIRLPKRAIDQARKEGQQPDAFYCLKMLERTGVVCLEVLNNSTWY